MLSLRLMRLMDSHSDQLASGLLQKITTSPECADLHKIPSDHLRARTYEIYRNLNDWLAGRTAEDVASRYTALGMERAQQGVALSHVIWGVREAKRNLWDFVEREGLWESPVELHGSLELLALLDRFFDDAIYHIARGYERYEAARAGMTRVA